MTDNKYLRQTFDAEAELYNKTRPDYPQEVFDTLIEKTHLVPDAHILEVGPGTGQATKSLAKYGYSIVAVELGHALADVARRELRQYKNVQVITSAFEDFQGVPKSFDLIFSATAFHWVESEKKFTQSHSLLKDGGYLAVIHRNHIGGDSFYTASNPIYKKYQEDRPKGSNEARSLITSSDDIKADGIIDERLFSLVYHHVFDDSKQYTADEYVKLISTYSPTLAMKEEKRRYFLKEIRELINSDFGGSAIRHYGISLTIGKKVG